jgi:hypothetical protein
VRPHSEAAGLSFALMSSKQPDPVIQRRHEAAMEVVPYVDTEERILLLGFVTGLIPPSPEFERLEAEHPPAKVAV